MWRVVVSGREEARDVGVWREWLTGPALVIRRVEILAPTTRGGLKRGNVVRELPGLRAANPTFGVIAREAPRAGRRRERDPFLEARGAHLVDEEFLVGRAQRDRTREIIAPRWLLCGRQGCDTLGRQRLRRRIRADDRGGQQRRRGERETQDGRKLHAAGET